MRNKSLKLCGFTVVMGIFGALLRWLQLQKIIEPDTLLAIPRSPWSYALVLFVLLFAVLLYIWIKRFKNLDFAPTFPEVYSKSVPFVNIIAEVIGAIIAIGGILTLLRGVRSSASAFDLILGLFAIIAAAGITSFIIYSNKPEKKNGGNIGATIIVFFLCFWLIASYKFSASDPVIWHFAFRLLAIVTTLLAFFHIAGFVFNKPKPLFSLYFGLLATFLCIISLADTYPIGERMVSLANPYPIGEQFILVGFIASMTLLSFTQLNSANPEN